MILFLSWIIPWIRTSGWLERDEARRHRNETGIVFGFRGPTAAQRAALPSAGWFSVHVSVDGVVKIDAASTSGRPMWCPVEPGVHRVEILPAGGDDEEPIGIDVRVPRSGRPAVVAVWPEYQRFGELRRARLEVVSDGS